MLKLVNEHIGTSHPYSPGPAIVIQSTCSLSSSVALCVDEIHKQIWRPLPSSTSRPASYEVLTPIEVTTTTWLALVLNLSFLSTLVLSAPVAVAGATAVPIAEAIRGAYNQAVTDVLLYSRLNSAITAQILAAVNPTFLSTLEDPDFGFSDGKPRVMLKHLRTEYGSMTPEELETNEMTLSDAWTFDDPIEDLWVKIANIQRVAIVGSVPIPIITIITLTFAMIEKSGL